MSSATVETKTVARPNADELRELEVFHRTLAELCRAEIPLPRAFRLLGTDLRRGRLRGAVDDMARAVENGATIADAYREQADRLPPLYAGLVEAGVNSGDLPGVLDAIAAHAQRRAAVSERLRNALRYPMVVAAFVIAIGAGLGIFIAPGLYELPTRFFDRGKFHSPLVYALGALGVFAIVVAALAVWGFKQKRIPVFGTFRRHAERASTAATLGLLLRRGTSLESALRWTAAAVDPGAQQQALEHATENAAAGAPLGACLRENAVFDPTLTWLVEAADGSDDAPRALDDVASIYERRLERAVERAAVFLAPAFQLIIGVIVFVLVFAFLGPFLEIGEGIMGL